eukprot:1575208-Prymnesium_polylepis.1
MSRAKPTILCASVLAQLAHHHERVAGEVQEAVGMLDGLPVGAAFVAARGKASAQHPLEISRVRQARRGRDRRQRALHRGLGRSKVARTHRRLRRRRCLLNGCCCRQEVGLINCPVDAG